MVGARRKTFTRFQDCRERWRDPNDSRCVLQTRTMDSAVIRRALLIGSPGPVSVPARRLAGVANDLEAMRVELEAWGFSCTVVFDDEATRDGILDALRDLRDAATSHHCVVVYYTGHGGRRRIDGDAGPAWNYLVPVDHSAETFRGVAEVELGDLLWEMCDRTPNVTVILDCCHAAATFRETTIFEHLRFFDDVRTEANGEGLRGALPIAWHDLPKALRARLRLDSEEAQVTLHADGHPEAVRLVATGSDSYAYEFADADTSGPTEYRGYFTTELCHALETSRMMRVPWDSIIRQVQERVFARRGTTTQRPELAGPRSRIPFSLEVFGDVRDHFTVTWRSDRSVWMRGGRLQGLSVGDGFALSDDRDTDLGTGEVVEVFDDSARLAVDRESHISRHLSAGSVAIPTKYQIRRGIWVEPAAQQFEALIASIDAAARLRWIDTIDCQDVLFRVGMVRDRLQLRAPRWVQRKSVQPDEAGIAAFVRDLDDVARAEILVEALGSPTGLGRVEYELEVFAEGPTSGRRTLGEHAVARVGERLCARVTHTTLHKPPIYVNALARGVDRRIGLLTQSEPTGIEVRAGETRWIGRRSGGTAGLELTWPHDVPPNTHGHGDLIFVISRRALDLRSLCEDSLAVRSSGDIQRSSTTSIDQLLGKKLQWATVWCSLDVVHR